ncbi:Diphthamide biosynthesis protein 2 [Coemansia sp. RSA 2337]|nr:Diphthamide biosynthesis protein 2 [Coemansia sp. S3946]KAJ2042621.1 Diphthamide biosynthesis protein 2 [Coemansia sp. S16]KAJ2070954.1 Diphthamide biosynthesis protein 2 [Coemansia sp. S155-1]KAJ2105634.1 Diphthamide biosynthesis protein 2 [Coemansia sp. RSA 922]KAJ2347724.1 Diphthamide biosynthesis protein 2 [Coemansia sp. RSA 2673]KAJ2463323.1 Diphthamide biosynthesis protein 2 [Coemansia sp. RSA 2337]
MASIDNDGSAVIQRQIDTGTTSACEHLAVSDALVVYEIEQTAAVITKGNYRRIALQFPDHLLGHSTVVSAELQSRIDSAAQVFILADTSYGSCCVDEVAADHYSADLVVHYGRTCLSLSSRIPVYYVFGREPMDPAHCAELVAEKMSGRNILVLCDVPYAYAMPDVVRALEQWRDDAGARVFGQVVSSEITVADRLFDPKTDTSSTIVPGRSWQLPPSASSIADYSILYLGAESLTLTNIILTMRGQGVFSYDPAARTLREESHKVNRHLARRYKMVQHARDADVIGIVVGTLAATRYLRVIEALKAMIRRAHKKFYVFVVGKLNVAKLANFAEIETYVLVACPENSLVDSKDFMSPVVTPFEMQLALSKTRQWTGDYVTDFHAFLDDAERELAEKEEETPSDDEPHFSLITGTLKQNRRYNDPRSQSTESGSAQLATMNKHTEIAQYMGSAGAEYLLTRSFRGLGHDDDPDNKSNEPLPAVMAVEGRSGIARGYDNEK